MTTTEWNQGAAQRIQHGVEQQATARKLRDTEAAVRGSAGRLAGRIFELFRRKPAASRLALLERMGIAPRQSLVLVEADGHKLLIGLSAEAAPTFFSLDAGRDPGQALPSGRIRLEGTVC